VNELTHSAEYVAQRVLGSVLERTIDGRTITARIVETEAYDQSDAASHSYKGKTPRNNVMFGPAGYFYVYFTYGMHYCCNIVTGEEGQGSAVLIRAVEIISGEQHVLRPGSGVALGNGPAKLCHALGIDKTMNGHKVQEKPLRLIMQPEVAKDRIVKTTRVGITKEKDARLRFYIASSPAVSRR
jgi:DNA-3-methyladenine glycosylase